MTVRYLNLCFLVFMMITGMVSCQNKGTGERNISVSILPQKYFVERIAGDYVKVNVMIPPGMNPATCDLSTGQLKKLYDSDICFAIGYLPFETTHLYPALENKAEVLLINHSADIDLIEGSCGHTHEEGHQHEGGFDPHIWLSPKYAMEMSRTILKVLSEKYPERAESFRENYARLEEDINGVAARADSVLAGKTHKTFLIYHPALTYFAQDYGLEQISIENEGKEPNPAHLKKIIDTTKEKDIHIIFIQSQFDVTNARSIANETGGKIIPIDPLNENWLEEMNTLIGILDENLH